MRQLTDTVRLSRSARKVAANGSDFRLSRLTVAGLCLFLAGLVGYVDYLTGYERSLLLFYLVPISLATWFGGLVFGLVISVVCVVIWVLSDIAAGIPSVGLWNAVMGLASYAAFTVVLSNLRTLLRELDQRVRERTAALQGEVTERERLDREIAQVADRERRRLGQDLHDHLGQHLTGTALAAQVLREKLAGKSAPEVADADRVVRYIEEGIDLTRNLARGFFSPELDADGLIVALQGVAENTTERFQIDCIFHGDETVPVGDSRVATQLYRIAQEAVTNAIKHAAAQRINIRLVRSDQTIVLTITDDGIGFPEALSKSEGLGLRLMAHGAALIGAKLAVGRNGMNGTIVTCKLNVPNETN